MRTSIPIICYNNNIRVQKTCENVQNHQMQLGDTPFYMMNPKTYIF